MALDRTKGTYAICCFGSLSESCATHRPSPTNVLWSCNALLPKVALFPGTHPTDTRLPNPKYNRPSQMLSSEFSAISAGIREFSAGVGVSSPRLSGPKLWRRRLLGDCSAFSGTFSMPQRLLGDMLHNRGRERGPRSTTSALCGAISQILFTKNPYSRCDRTDIVQR